MWHDEVVNGGLPEDFGLYLGEDRDVEEPHGTHDKGVAWHGTICVVSWEKGG